MTDLTTGRLRLRQWREEDLEPFAALNADPEVMRYFPAPLSRAESDAMAAAARAKIARRGWGVWAVEQRAGGAFVGCVGLDDATFAAPFTPAVEADWRLGRAWWGRGYATEAAGAALAFGFRTLGLEEIVSFTAVVNERSWRVMERLGMSRDPDGDFDHPRVEGPPLRRHVLYRLSRAAWEQAGGVGSRPPGGRTS